MNSISLYRLGGLALIAGPVLSIVFFLLQPGGLLIDNADSSDAVASITSFASNSTLTIVTSMVIALGLLLIVFGFYAVQKITRSNGIGDALSQFGLLALIIGAFGWIVAQGIHVALADADLQDLNAWVPVYSVYAGITLMSAIAVSLGFLTFSLALSTRDDFNKIVALVVSIVSVVAFVCFIAAAVVPEQTDTMILIGRICYFPWTIWGILLGLDLLKSDYEV